MKNKKKLLIVLFIVLLLVVVRYCVHIDGPYKGKVVELETGNPIEGAVVAASWRITAWINTDIICDAKETVTNKNGEFELPRGWCISHPLAKINKPSIVVFKPSYLGYPPLGSNEEERKTYMPDWGNPRLFEDKEQYNVIKLGEPKTLKERELTHYDAERLIYHKSAQKLPILLNMTIEESKKLGLGERLTK